MYIIVLTKQPFTKIKDINLLKVDCFCNNV